MQNTGVKIELVELNPGAKYAFITPEDGTLEFIAEAGGIISGENINGTVQAGKVIFTANKNEYEGHFTSQTEVVMTNTFLGDGREATG